MQCCLCNLRNLYQFSFLTMEQIIINVKDHSKLPFLMEFLELFKFIEVQQKTSKKSKADQYNFFESAGIWKDRDVNANQLREQAWKTRK